MVFLLQLIQILCLDIFLLRLCCCVEVMILDEIYLGCSYEIYVRLA